MAALGNHCENMQLLLNAGADPDSKCDDGRTATMCAASKGNCAAIGNLYLHVSIILHLE